MLRGRLRRRSRPAVAEKHLRYKARVLKSTLHEAVNADYRSDIEARFLHGYLSRRSVVLDVGANAGAYAAVVEDVVGPRSLVIFEPLPQLVSLLRARFPGSEVRPVALSDQSGQAKIRIPSIAGKAYSTRATLSDHEEPGQSGFEEVEIGLETLDAAVADLALKRIDVVKIDVEGHELEVIAGARGSLERYQPMVLIEIEARHHTFPIIEVFARLEECGLRGYFFDPRTMTVRPVADLDVERDQRLEHLEARDFIRYLNNFWFVPPSRERDFLARAARFLADLEPLDGS
jgi:FkbM family methyltransferase